MASRSLLAVLVLLLGLHGTYAAMCTTTALAGTATCTCPGGIAATAEALKFSVATAGVVTTITRIAHVGTTVDITKCANVQKGYEIKTASANYGLTGLVTLTPGVTIVGANSYSAEQVGKVTYTNGKISGLTQSLATACPTGIGHASTGKALITDCQDLLAKYTFIPSVTAGTTISGLVRACVVNEYGCRGKVGVFVQTWTKTNTGITGADMRLTGANSIVAVTTAAAGTVTTTTLLPFACPTKSATTLAQTIGVTIAACLVDKDYYIDATNLLTPLACPAGSICVGGFAVGTASVANTGLYGVCTTTTLGTAGYKCYCPGGTTAVASGTNYDVAIGTGDIYGTLTHVGGTDTKVGVCDDIMPGYEVKTASTTTLDITPAATLTAGITAIAANSFAPSVVNKVTYTGAKITALAQSLATSCPTGTGNSLTSAATGTAAVSFQTACVDLLAKFSFKKSVASTTSLNNLVVACKADQYNCPGSANLFSIKNVDAGTGIFNTGNNMDITALNAIGATGTINQGTLLLESCPAGSSTTSAQTVLTTVAGCTVNGGYYIDASDLEVPSICPIGDYCIGGGAVGTAGGVTSCPYGSSTELASAQNSRVSDCAVSSGFYIATGALNTPVPCLASFICSGGTPLGTAGGSVACPVGSLHASCAGSSPSTSTTVSVSATPISVATPDVTVTNTVPSASSASTNVASMVLLAVSAAMVAF